MMQPSRRSYQFIVEAFDCDLWCPVAQTLFHVAGIDTLRSILGTAADKDPELEYTYHLDDEQLAVLVAQFGVRFDRSQLEGPNLLIRLFRRSHQSQAPYLIHTGYELPLLLDGRKKLARMTHEYPPMTFDGEDRFDHWVAEGLLHRKEVIEPFDSRYGEFLGHRTVYYVPKGEEWRIPASQLIWQASGKSGGWNEHFERLEGMLFGYEDWQNDWWIDFGLQGGGFGGVTFCCPVTSAGLAWIEAAGFRALPPVQEPALPIASYIEDNKAELHGFMLENPDSAALVRFNVLGKHVMDFIDLRHGPWHVPAERIGQLNQNLRGSVVIVARRDDPFSSKSA